MARRINEIYKTKRVIKKKIESGRKVNWQLKEETLKGEKEKENMPWVA